MTKKTSRASQVAVSPAVTPSASPSDRDVTIVRFRPNGRCDAMDERNRPIPELCGHSASRWALIEPRLRDDHKLFLMIHGGEKRIDASMVPTIQLW